jgi:transcriptional regulator with XRE-family HTH domain
MKKDFSELSAFFREQGITQEEIAQRLGVSQQYVSGLLSGRKPFGKKQAQRFYELWQISPSWLLTGEGSMMAGSVIGEHNTVNNGRDQTVQTDAGLVAALREAQAQNAKSQQHIDRLLAIIEGFQNSQK